MIACGASSQRAPDKPVPLRKLQPSFHERPWGTSRLDPWFPNSTARIGEAWFDAGPDAPRVKFLFTTEKLSVQVHPDDEYAREHHSCPGKTEMWHVLSAVPGARIAAGFREPVTREQVAAAARTGGIEELLQWHEARPGDTFLIPAGTVHAIGAGLTICEIQQRSDITYRLHDYGRPRELHLEEALAVANLNPVDARRALPVQCHAFTAVSGLAPRPDGPQLLIALEGQGSLDGQDITAGEVFYVPASADLAAAGHLDILRTFSPL